MKQGDMARARTNAYFNGILFCPPQYQEQQQPIHDKLLGSSL